MKNKKQGFNPTETKKAIQQKMAAFEQRIFDARNDFELAQVLQEMADVLKSEIDSWILKVAEAGTLGVKIAKSVVNAADQIEDALGIDRGEDHVTLIDRAAKFIGEFEELLQTIREQYEAIYDNAKNIERVYIANHKLKSPVLKELI